MVVLACVFMVCLTAIIITGLIVGAHKDRTPSK